MLVCVVHTKPIGLCQEGLAHLPLFLAFLICSILEQVELKNSNRNSNRNSKFEKGEFMKYLIKHKKEFVLTIVWFVILAYVLYDGFKNGREVQSVIETIVGITVWYLNNPTSVEGSNAKISMLEDKELRGAVMTDVEEPSDSEVIDND